MRASRCLGGSAFLENVDDIQSFALGEFMQFKKLRLNGQHLAVAFVRGFADVNEEIVWRYFHEFIIADIPERSSIELKASELF